MKDIFNLKGGRGFINVIQRLFIEEVEKINLRLNLESSTTIDIIKPEVIKIYISGIGMFSTEYDKKYDYNDHREMNIEIFKELPESSYDGEISIKNGEEYECLGFLSTLMIAPHQNIEELTKSLTISINRFQEELDNYKKEISNLETNGK